jgi:hypothetical protein
MVSFNTTGLSIWLLWCFSLFLVCFIFWHISKLLPLIPSPSSVRPTHSQHKLAPVITGKRKLDTNVCILLQTFSLRPFSFPLPAQDSLTVLLTRFLLMCSWAFPHQFGIDTSYANSQKANSTQGSMVSFHCCISWSYIYFTAT